MLPERGGEPTEKKLKGFSHRPHRENVSICPKGVLGSIFPRLHSCSIEHKMKRFPIIEHLVAISDRSEVGSAHSKSYTKNGERSPKLVGKHVLTGKKGNGANKIDACEFADNSKRC
mmetsp:Transcript_36164/g.77116  ORF Transcript_36164/g.77116 Transcript_36164/m.77116 type:complete len:116 (+) Transcript_36164:1692-2039(+)